MGLVGDVKGGEAIACCSHLPQCLKIGRKKTEHQMKGKLNYIIWQGFAWKCDVLHSVDHVLLQSTAFKSLWGGGVGALWVAIII